MSEDVPRILCVDDTQEYCDTIADRLAKLPARVDVAYSGQDAVAKLNESSQHNDPYALVTLDMYMPKEANAIIDQRLGMRFLTELRGLIPQTTHIIVYTTPAPLRPAL